MSSTADSGPPFGALAPNRAQAALIGLAQRSVLRRGAFRAPVSRLVRALGSPVLDVAFRGCSYRLHGGRDGIEYGILLNPAYNAEDIGFLAEGLPAGGIFVDIGCNIGLYTLPLARQAGPVGRVLAVDANAVVTARLAFNAAASGLANVTLVTSAVSDRDGSAVLQLGEGDLGMVSVDDSIAGPVPLRQLADILAEAGISRIDALKIDVEGHEDRALAPFLHSAAAGLLPARIVIERPPGDVGHPACQAALAARGYARCGQTRRNWFYRRDQSAS